MIQTLWPIKGPQEAEIIENFLAENKNQKNFSLALHLAKRHFLRKYDDKGRSETFLNPYYWSGPVLIGAYN